MLPTRIFQPDSAERPVAAALLEACANEPIHIPDAIQPHGLLLVLDERDLLVVQASANAWPVLGTPVDRDGTAVAAVPLHRLGAALAAAVARVVPEGDLTRPFPLGAFELPGADGRPGGERFDALIHRHDGALLLELEPAVGDPPPYFASMHALVRTFVGSLQSVQSLPDLCDLAAREMQRITRFGRTLVYRFDANGHGEVLAESIEPGYDSYSGHRFPASDIPPQARALYERNHVRLIASADYEPSPLVPAVRPGAGRPTDLSYAALRSVSPVHLEYMRNMGTGASMSVSIMVHGKLWGLVSCHHATSRRVPFTVRLAAEHLGQILSLQIESKESYEDVEYGLELRRILVSVVASTAERGGALESLTSAGDDLLRMAGADGAAVVVGDQCTTVGRTPAPAQILALAEWFALQGRELFATDRLQELFPEADAYADVASGVMAIGVSQLHRHCVIWFRPEVVRTVLWAGDPHKATIRGDDPSRLHPRRSFATWREEVRGSAAPWRASEITVAGDLRHALLNIVLRRAEEVAALANELGRINKELEAFSYSVSHDLRAPLRHITGYADLVRDFEGANLSERGLRFLGHIKEAARFAGTLVDDLLAFSQMGRTTLRPIRVDLNELVKGVIHNMRIDGTGDGVAWDIGPLPVVIADPVFMQVAMQNLLANAVKYSARREPPQVTVRGEEREDSVTVRVSDNGVGFDMRYVGKLFGVFQRLHRVEEFAGTGIGLASVRRAVERHGGTVEARGEIDKGATFAFTLPKVTAATAAPATPAPASAAPTPAASHPAVSA